MSGGCWIQIASSNNAYFDNTLQDDIIIRSDGNTSKIFISPIKTDLDSATMCIGSNSVNVVGDAGITGNLSANGLVGPCISGNINSTASNIAASLLAVKTTYDVAIAANNTAIAANTTASTALPKAGGTVTGDVILSGVGTQVLGDGVDNVANPSFSWNGDATTGVYRSGAGSVGISTTGVNRATINSVGLAVAGALDATTITGTCISSSTISTSNNIAASSSAVKTTYDLANTANTTAGLALPKAGGTVTGDVILSGVGTQVLGDGADNVENPSFSWNGDATTGVYRIAAGQIGFSAGGVNKATISSTGLNASALTGCISDSTSSALTNIAASSLAVKNTYDLANSANAAANAANTTANTANTTANAALPKVGGSVTGDVILSGTGVQVLGDGTDNATNPSFSWNGDATTGVYRIGAGSVGISTTGVNRATINSSGLTVTGALNATTIAGTCVSDSINSSAANVAASSLAVKLAYDRALAAGSATFSNGTVSLPSITFTNDTNTGIYSVGTDSMGFAAGGVNSMTVNYSNVSVGSTVLIQKNPLDASKMGKTRFTCGDGDGSGGMLSILPGALTGAAARVVWISALDNNGIYNTTGGNEALGSSSNSVPLHIRGQSINMYGWESVHLSARDGVNMGSTTFFPSGSVTAPSISFSSDSNAGMYYANSAIGITTDGVQKLSIGPTGLRNSLAGTGAEPSYTFTANANTGMYLDSTNVLGFSTGGVNRVKINSAGIDIAGSLSSSNIVVEATSRLLTDASVNNQYQIIVATTGVSTGESCGIVFTAGTVPVTGSTTGGSAIVYERIGGSTYQGNLHFKTQGGGVGTALSKRMMIGWNGLVGVNTTTPRYQFDVNGDIGTTGNVLAGNGTAALPSHTFTSDANTGMYLASPDKIGFSTGGVERMAIAGSVIDIGEVRLNGWLGSKNELGRTSFHSGPIGTPGARFNIMVGGNNGQSAEYIYMSALKNDSTASEALGSVADCVGMQTVSGYYKIVAYDDIDIISSSNVIFRAGATGIIYLQTNNITRAYVNDVGFYIDRMLADNGSVDAPAIGFSSDGGTGFYRGGTGGVGNIGVSASGTAIALFNTGGFRTYGRVTGNNFYTISGTEALPGYTFDGDENTGMYRQFTDQIGFSSAGVKRVVIAPSGLFTYGCPLTLDGSMSLTGDITRTAGIFKITSSDQIQFYVPTAYSILSFFGGVQKLSVNTNGIDVAGTVKSNGTTLTSDDRVKTEEEFITNALDTVDKLRPQIYNKHMYLDYTNPDDTITRESGLIAQEIYYDAPELRHLVHVPEGADQAALDAYVPSSSNPSEDPEMYNLWGSNLASVNYVGLVPYLVKSIQELRVEGIQKDSEINVLNDQATAMNTQYNDLLARVLALESK